MFWNAACFFLRAEGFFCNFDIGKLRFLIKKRLKKKIAAVFFSSVFGRQNPRSGLDPCPDRDSLDMLDPNPDPQLCE